MTAALGAAPPSAALPARVLLAMVLACCLTALAAVFAGDHASRALEVSAHAVAAVHEAPHDARGASPATSPIISASAVSLPAGTVTAMDQQVDHSTTFSPGYTVDGDRETPAGGAGHDVEHHHVDLDPWGSSSGLTHPHSGAAPDALGGQVHLLSPRSILPHPD